MSPNVLRMPRLSDSMDEATIVAWLKQPGEAFLRGEPLIEIETDSLSEWEARRRATEASPGPGRP